MSPPPDQLWMQLCLACALIPFSLFLVNLFFYRTPRRVRSTSSAGAVSVLIPARNEEHGIVAAVESVLASTGVELELLVLDDASVDNTAALVAALAEDNGCLRLHQGPALPEGWNGKQHACAALARLARYDTLCFLDADVRLEPEALCTLLQEFDRGQAELITGFPRQETGTWLEKLLIPLIHFILLSYLPLPGLRLRPRSASFAAGCGQVMLVRRTAYEASGGHGAIRGTMHDGILLPRLLREKGFRTDLFDLTHLARCRMYRSAAEVWHGLGKNATEGMAAPARILPFTFLLLFGQIVPVIWLLYACLMGQLWFWPAVALAGGYAVRFICAGRFRQSLMGAALHPIGVVVLLILQWFALARKLLGRQASWKQRVYDMG